jgi:hypothetical protein
VVRQPEPSLTKTIRSAPLEPLKLRHRLTFLELDAAVFHDTTAGIHVPIYAPRHSSAERSVKLKFLMDWSLAHGVGEKSG